MKIVIVGGGISGWLSALIFSYKKPNHEYVIIESPDVNTIGVGEGTTGIFTDVLDDLPDTSIQEFLRETKGTPFISVGLPISVQRGAPSQCAMASQDPSSNGL